MIFESWGCQPHKFSTHARMYACRVCVTQADEGYGECAQDEEYGKCTQADGQRLCVWTRCSPEQRICGGSDTLARSRPGPGGTGQGQSPLLGTVSLQSRSLTSDLQTSAPDALHIHQLCQLILSLLSRSPGVGIIGVQV